MMTTREMIKIALDLTEKGFKGENPKYIAKQKKKILFHTLLSPSFAKKWFDIILSKEHNWITEHRPRLYFKPFRVYMSTRWRKQRRLEALESCYSFVKQHSFLFKVITTENPIKIAEFSLKNSENKGEVFIGYNERFRKEGEFSISVHCPPFEQAICELSFLIEEENTGEWVCRMGCVQGNKASETENSIKELQKQMYGLRPKAFMVFIMQEITKALGCTKLYGVSNKIQAHNKKHFIHIGFLHKLSFNYDALWREVDGKPSAEGWFLLPRELHRKDMSEIKSAKRNLYRNRYELLDSIARQIEGTFNEKNTNNLS